MGFEPQNPDKEMNRRELSNQPMRVQIAGLPHTVTDTGSFPTVVLGQLFQLEEECLPRIYILRMHGSELFISLQ